MLGSNSVDIRTVAQNMRTDCANEAGFFAEDFPFGQLEGVYPPFDLNIYLSMPLNDRSCFWLSFRRAQQCNEMWIGFAQE